MNIKKLLFALLGLALAAIVVRPAAVKLLKARSDDDTDE